MPHSLLYADSFGTSATARHHRAGRFDLHRQARDKKAVRAADLVEVGELFDLAVFAA